MKKAALFLLMAGLAWGDTIVTLPGGSNGAIQINKRGAFSGDTSLMYSTSTHVLGVPNVSITSLTSNGLTWTFPAAHVGGGSLIDDGSGHLTVGTPSVIAISSGTNISVFDGGVQVSTALGRMVMDANQFRATLSGGTTVAFALDPSSVTLLGQTINIGNNTDLSVSSPLIRSGSSLRVDPSSVTMLGPTINLGGTGVTGTVLSTNLPGTVVYSNTTQGIDGVKTFSSSVTVTHAAGLIAPAVVTSTITASSTTINGSMTVNVTNAAQNGIVLNQQNTGAVESHVLFNQQGNTYGQFKQLYYNSPGNYTTPLRISNGNGAININYPGQVAINGDSLVSTLTVVGNVAIGATPTAPPINGLSVQGPTVLASSMTGTFFRFDSPLQSTVTYGLTVGSMTITGSTTVGGGFDAAEGGEAPGIDVAFVAWADSTTHRLKYKPNNGPAYVASGSSVAVVTGECAKWSGTGDLISGTCGGSGSGAINSGTAGNLAYYSVAGGTIAPVSYTIITPSSMTVTSTITINTGGGDNTTPGLFNIFTGNSSPGRYLFTIGTQGQTDQIIFRDRIAADFSHYGVQAGQLLVGDTPSGFSQRIYSNGDHSSYFDLRTGSTMTWNTGTANGPGDMRFQPGGVLQETFSTQTGATIISTLTVLSNPSSINAAIVLASGTATYGVYSDPDFYQLYNSGNTKECIGFRQAGDNAGSNPPMSICRAGGSGTLDFGFKGAGGGASVPLSITTNGSYPQGSSVTVSAPFMATQQANLGNQLSTTTITGNLALRGGLALSTWTANGSGGVVNANYMTGPTDNVIFASSTAGGITITLAPASSVTGKVLQITKVDTTTNTVRGLTTDLINGTTRIFVLNSVGQTAEIISDGNGWWSHGQGIQVTPHAISAVGNVGGTAAIGVSSSVYTCAITIPVPVTLIGFRYGPNAMAAPAQVAFGLYDFAGNLIASTGPVNGSTTLANATVLLGAGNHVNVPPGQYYIGTQGSNTAISMAGGTNSTTGPFCEVTASTSMGMPATVTVVGGSGTGRIFGTYLIFNGGRISE